MQIYSQVDGALRVELFDTNETPDLLINEVLVSEGLAVACEEPYNSRVSSDPTFCVSQ